MAEPLDLRWRHRETRLHGERIAVVDIEIPDAAPDDVKEGLARRARVNAGGVCPCGARMVLPNRAARRKAKGRPLAVTVEHENDCPALLRGYAMFDLGRW